MIIQRGVGKGSNGLGHIVTGSLHGDIVVVREVNASRYLGRIVGEEFAFQTRVGRADDVLSITPLAISRTALGETAAAAGAAAVGARLTWVSVSIWIERLTRTCVGIPVGVTIGTSRTEIVGISPVTTGSTPTRTVNLKGQEKERRRLVEHTLEPKNLLRQAEGPHRPPTRPSDVDGGGEGCRGRVRLGRAHAESR